MDSFLEGDEKLVRNQNIYDREHLSTPFGVVIVHIMKYFNLEGHLTIVHGYHFSFLCHIHKIERINIPFFLFSSLKQCKAKGASPLHQGLIQFLYNYVVAITPLSGPPSSIPTSFVTPISHVEPLLDPSLATSSDVGPSSVRHPMKIPLLAHQSFNTLQLKAFLPRVTLLLKI